MALPRDAREVLGAVYRVPGSLDVAEREALHAALVAVADEFVPPLTVRRSTMQGDLQGLHPSRPTEVGVGRYFAEMLDQHTLLVPRQRTSLAAFCSFRVGCTHPALVGLGLCTYVSTIAVLPEHRRAGLARQLYASLFELDAVRGQPVALRTWSTNTGHLGLLADLGFDTVARLPDDRGPSIDTVYLARLPR